MDARAFQALLAPASWNGIPFHAMKEESDAEHRISTEDIPHGSSVVERFGKKLQKHNLDAYLTGVDAASRAMALVAAMETGEVGALVLPTGGMRNARILRVRRAFEKDKLGWINLSIEAQDEPDDTGFTSTPNSLANEGFALLAQAGAALGPALGNSLRSGPLGFRGVVLEGFITSAHDEISRIAGLATALRLPPETRVTVQNALGLALDSVPQIPAIPALYATALVDVASALGSAVDVTVLLAEIAAAPALKTPTGPFLGVIDPVLSQNASALAATTDSALLIAAVHAAIATKFTSRVEAVQARANLAALSAETLSRHNASSLDLPDLLARSVGLAGHLLQRVITDLAPLMTVEMPVSMPALWWSHRLYGRAENHLRLSSLARAPHPLFMPVIFEAEANA